ncbi:MAG: FkbM family methyltransferase [Candidatus Acidiferrales bacterium]
MSLATDFVHFTGRAFRKAGRVLMDYRALRGVWLDVGAFKGEHCYGHALYNPSLRVFAFEPNLELAVKLFNLLPNFFVIPAAVTETDGYADLNVSAYPAASSLLPFDDVNVSKWVGGQDFRVLSKLVVPTIRLDTFLNLTGIDTVDYLKINAQGLDLAVVKSAGNRLKDIRRIYLEVYVTPHPLYHGVPTKPEIIEFLGARGFSLVEVETQSDGQEENLTFQNTGAGTK